MRHNYKAVLRCLGQNSFMGRAWRRAAFRSCSPSDFEIVLDGVDIDFKFLLAERCDAARGAGLLADKRLPHIDVAGHSQFLDL